MAYASVVTTAQIGENAFRVQIVETEGPDPASGAEHVPIDVPGLRPYQPVELIRCRAWSSGASVSTVQPKLRNVESTDTDDGSIEWEAEAAAAAINEEARAVINADADGTLLFYSTPDSTPTGVDSVTTVLTMRLVPAELPR